MFTDLKIPAGRRPMAPGEAKIAAIIGISFTIMIGVAVFEEFSVERLSIVFVILFWAPMLILHELGHAVAARLLGWRVREIVIGFGRDLWQWQSGETRVRIKLAPVEGYVLPAPRDAKNIRVKSMLIYAAGPGAELLLLALMLALFGWDYVFSASDDIAQIAVQSLAIVILLGAGFNLLPFRTEGAVSDGLGIISSPFMSDSSIELRLLTFELRELQKILDDGDSANAVSSIREYLGRFPGNPALQLLLVSALSANEQTEDARSNVRDQLAQSELSEELRQAWLHQQALVELNANEPSYLVLDLALQKSMAITSASSELLATKGAALVLRGQYETGGNLLADAWRQNDGSASDADMLAYLTIAAHRSGARAAAEHFGNSFVQVNRSNWLAKRVQKLTGQTVS